MITPEQAKDLDNRFESHLANDHKQNSMAEMRSAIRYVALVTLRVVPPGREQALALTKLEEAMFWSNAGIARKES